MVGKRNRILDLKSYIESLGVSVNIAKNKAQGNKGFFKAQNGNFRIDIASGLNDDATLSTLCHEFGHLVHYKYDNKLQTLNFLFDNVGDELIEDMIRVTVDLIPKEQAKPLFDKKRSLQNEIKSLASSISVSYPNFIVSKLNKELEKSIGKTVYKPLLKYDRVRILNFFSSHIYSISLLKSSDGLKECEINYLKLKSKQRELKRINSRINKLNRYYNSMTELFARSFEMFAVNPERLKSCSPKLYENFCEVVKNNKIPELTTFIEIFSGNNL